MRISLRGALAVSALWRLFVACHVLAAPSVRIKDIAVVDGVRANQLLGFGLVAGLNGSGDDSQLARQMLDNMFQKQRMSIPQALLSTGNVAAVTVTANLPPFVRPGLRIDVVVSSVGDAKTLEGGILLQSPLRGADGEVYAVAQGAVSIGGFNVGGNAARVMKNHATVGRIPNGALIEREVPVSILDGDHIRIQLREPDFTSAVRLAEVINAQFQDTAAATDPATVRVTVPEGLRKPDGLMRFVSTVEALAVTPDAAARVVINERTGTIVAGENVRISTVAISHGALAITIRESANVSQPGPFSSGNTVKVDETDIKVSEGEGALHVIQAGVTIAEVARALNVLGASPRDVIAIFQTIKRAGALQAELIIM